MKLLKTIPLLFFIAINLLVVVAMNFCAYTSCLPPQDHPSTSYYGLMFPLFLILNSLFIPFWLIFKWKITLLPLLGTLLCAGSARAYFPLNLPKEPPQGSLKVLSYNVMAFGKGNIAEWEQNPILNYILESDADILSGICRKIDETACPISIFIVYGCECCKRSCVGSCS